MRVWSSVHVGSWSPTMTSSRCFLCESVLVTWILHWGGRLLVCEEFSVDVKGSRCECVWFQLLLWFSFMREVHRRAVNMTHTYPSLHGVKKRTSFGKLSSGARPTRLFQGQCWLWEIKETETDSCDRYLHAVKMKIFQQMMEKNKVSATLLVHFDFMLLYTSSARHLFDAFTYLLLCGFRSFSVCRLQIVTCYQSGSVVGGTLCDKILQQRQSRTLRNI